VESVPYQSDVLRPKRPALIWITQILALLVATATIFVAFETAVAWLTDLRSGITVIQFLRALLIQVFVGGMALLLFGGLVKPRGWARWGSVIFAICLFVLYAVAKHQLAAKPDTFTPSEAVGAGIAEIILVFALALYPTRLYFSKKVRKFFGIEPK